MGERRAVQQRLGSLDELLSLRDPDVIAPPRSRTAEPLVGVVVGRSLLPRTGRSRSTPNAQPVASGLVLRPAANARSTLTTGGASRQLSSGACQEAAPRFGSRSACRRWRCRFRVVQSSKRSDDHPTAGSVARQPKQRRRGCRNGHRRAAESDTCAATRAPPRSARARARLQAPASLRARGSQVAKAGSSGVARNGALGQTVRLPIRAYSSVTAPEALPQPPPSRDAHQRWHLRGFHRRGEA
jgi:hypothetical protein